MQTRAGIPEGREALCWYCKHVWWDAGSQGYSEYTPGDPADIRCRKDHWRVKSFQTELAEFRTFLQMAATCPDFEPHTGPEDEIGWGG